MATSPRVSESAILTAFVIGFALLAGWAGWTILSPFFAAIRQSFAVVAQ